MTSQAEEEEVVFVYNDGVEVQENVTKIIFDASVTEIPNGMNHQLVNCRGVFSHCKRLKEVVLNEGFHKIGDNAFSDCTSLAVIKWSSTVTEISAGAFASCTNLMEVVLNEGLQEIGHRAFDRCTSLGRIKLPLTVTEVGRMAFCGCGNLREVALNEGLQKIGDGAFSRCTSLKRIIFPSTLTEIGRNAFARCMVLREVELNEGLWEIGNGAFHGCSSSAVVNIPSISKRAKNLIEAGQTIDIEGKLLGYRHFGWRGGDLLVTPLAIRDGNWAAVRTNLSQVLAWISHYELKEATTLFELAFWKARIEAIEAVTDEERSACRGEVPGPAKDAILQYYG